MFLDYVTTKLFSHKSVWRKIMLIMRSLYMWLDLRKAAFHAQLEIPYLK